jgi:predicted transcriptional regulator
MTKVQYQRCCLTLDSETLRRLDELMKLLGQSRSSLARYVIHRFYDEMALAAHKAKSWEDGLPF